MLNIPKSFDELLADPAKFGAPTFDEFRKSPDSYMKKEDQILERADAGSKVMRDNVRHHLYELCGIKCESPEQLERIAKDEGISLYECEMQPEILPLVGGQCDILVRIVPKKKEVGSEVLR